MYDSSCVNVPFNILNGQNAELFYNKPLLKRSQISSNFHSLKSFIEFQNPKLKQLCLLDV